MFEYISNLFKVASGPGGIIISMNPYAVFIGLALVVFLYLFIRANRSGALDWTDMITYTGPSNQVSLTKVLQLTGGVVATWIMVYTTLHDKLNVDLFLAYLTYVGAIEGWSRFVTAKYGVSDGTGSTPPKTISIVAAPAPVTPIAAAPTAPATVQISAADLDAALPKKG